MYSDDIDLSAGNRRRPISRRFNPVVPANALLLAGSLQYTSSISEPEVQVFPQSHVIDVLSLLSNNLNKVQNNVAAVCYKHGAPIGTCIFIGPELVLTARHVIEGELPSNLEVRRFYSLYAWGLDYGIAYTIAGIVEENIAEDFVILRLSLSVSNYQTMTLNLSSSDHGITFLVHHPDAQPKQISSHRSMRSDHYQVSYSGFHDSDRGSSGGIYFTASGELVAMHHLYFMSQTRAGLLREIYAQSQVLRIMFDQSGKQKYLDVRGPCSNNILPLREVTLVLKRERALTAPQGMLMPVKDQDTPAPELARHHIVPCGNMQFLWLISQEHKGIHDLLEILAYERQVSMQNVGYAAWNLFAGPKNRSDDPKDGNIEEKNKPLNFDKRIWDSLQKLHTQLNKAWKLRHVLANISHSGKSEKPETTAAYRASVLDKLNQLDITIGNFAGIKNPFALDTEKAKRDQALKDYQKVLQIINMILTNIKNRLSSLKQSPDTLHAYDHNEWLPVMKTTVIIRRNETKFSVIK